MPQQVFRALTIAITLEVRLSIACFTITLTKAIDRELETSISEQGWTRHPLWQSIVSK